MKRLHIRWKIMIWHSLFLLLVFMIIFPTIYLIVSNNFYSNAEKQLRSEAVQIGIALRDNNWQDEPDSSLDKALVGIYIGIYSKTNTQIAGWIPTEYNVNLAPSLGEIRYSSAGSHKLIILDSPLIVNGRINGWYRVVRTLDFITNTLALMREMIVIVIPVFTIISILLMFGGGCISLALSPVKKIAQTAQEVGQGDLSKRIHLSTGALDEVNVLANSFDEMLDRLEDSFDREKRFSSDVSHELRTPVTAIIANAEESLNGKKTPDEYKESLENILAEGNRMNTLISQLLIMARGNDGSIMQEAEPIDISMLTEAVVDEVKNMPAHPDIAISADIESGIILLVEQTLYMRLLFNLIDNALKYNVPGGWVKVVLRKEDASIFLSVEDGGIGISEDNLPRIWDRFFKATKHTANSSPGLGLSLVKWIAEQFGGTVSVKSELGKGSIFEIRFPA